jgi:hypothetical protein
LARSEEVVAFEAKECRRKLIGGKNMNKMQPCHKMGLLDSKAVLARTGIIDLVRVQSWTASL